MPEITTIIYAHNAEKEIKESVVSANLLSKKVVVVNIQSDDDTGIVAKKAGAEVFDFPFTSYVEPSRQFGIEQAQTDWILVLDSDERLTSELAEEIKKVIKNKDFSHYKIPRENIFSRRKWLKHGGWWPDHQLRLINKKYFKGWPKEIHSTPQIEGSGSLLTNPMTHYFHGDITQMVGKTTTFEDIESSLLHKAGRDVSTPTFFRKYFGELGRRLIIHLGFLDGGIGIIESIYQAFSKTITWLYLYEKRNRRSL